MDISGTQLRAVRAALFTAMVVTLSTASHVLLSRVPLPMGTVAAIAAAVFVLAYALGGPRARLRADRRPADTAGAGRRHRLHHGPARLLRQGGRPGRRSAALGRLRRAVRRRRRRHPAGPGDRHRRRPRRRPAHPRRPDRRLAAARRAHRRRTPRGRLAAPRRAGAGAAAARGGRVHLPAAADRGRRGDGTAARTGTPACSAPRRRTATARTRLFVHSLGRRGPPSSVAFA